MIVRKKWLMLLTCLALLNGCNSGDSKDAFTESQNVLVSYDVEMVNKTSVGVNENTALPGGTMQIQLVSVFADGSKKIITNELTYESLDVDVATVTENGVIRGINPGTTTVLVRRKTTTASAFSFSLISSAYANEQADIIARIPVTILGLPLTGLTLEQPQGSVSVGQNVQLISTGAFEGNVSDTISSTVTWSVDNDANCHH